MNEPKFVDHMPEPARSEMRAYLAGAPAPEFVTASSLRALLPVGGSVRDANTIVDGLRVRVWWSDAHPVYGWKWSVDGEGPNVWYPDVDMAFDYLARHWEGIAREAKEGDLRETLADVVRDRSDLLRQVRDLRAERDLWRQRSADLQDKLTSLRSSVAGVQNILGRALTGEVSND